MLHRPTKKGKYQRAQEKLRKLGREVVLTHAGTLEDRIARITDETWHSAVISGKTYHKSVDEETGTTTYYRIQEGAIKGRDGIVRPTKRMVKYYEYKKGE